ncbi:hypothetical protein Y032_0350g3210 [Ancylostoma ceylanicum]|uniref:Uncharacterized protein n=1 Tax=Ancylostoma ceylanicum TaxID=53326 RepID=A0A016RXS8_9BILA|nr:hypothetical protein Y032_0350g3210 [Ancylostoma ceylanicum]
MGAGSGRHVSPPSKQNNRCRTLRHVSRPSVGRQQQLAEAHADRPGAQRAEAPPATGQHASCRRRRGGNEGELRVSDYQLAIVRADMGVATFARQKPAEDSED